MSEEENILRELEHRYEYFQEKTYPRPKGVRIPQVKFLDRVRWREMFGNAAQDPPHRGMFDDCCGAEAKKETKTVVRFGS